MLRDEIVMLDIESSTLALLYLFFAEFVGPTITPFAVHLQKISIHLCSNLFHYG